MGSKPPMSLWSSANLTKFSWNVRNQRLPEQLVWHCTICARGHTLQIHFYEKGIAGYVNKNTQCIHFRDCLHTYSSWNYFMITSALHTCQKTLSNYIGIESHPGLLYVSKESLRNNIKICMKLHAKSWHSKQASIPRKTHMGCNIWKHSTTLQYQ